MVATRLDIYIEEGCIGSRRAEELADWVRSRFPAVEVRMMTPGEDSSDQARLVRATPTYFLDGKQFSLGNPSPEELARVLSSSRDEAQ